MCIYDDGNSVQWRSQTQEVGGQRLGDLGDGVPQWGSGAEPRWGLGAKRPEADAYTRFIVAKSRYFHYNLRSSTSRGLEVFRVYDEWFTEAD